MAEVGADFGANNYRYPHPSLLLRSENCSSLRDDSMDPTAPLRGATALLAKAQVIDAAALSAEQLNGEGVSLLLNSLPMSERVSAARAMKAIIEQQAKAHTNLPTIQLSTRTDASGQEVLLGVTAKVKPDLIPSLAAEQSNNKSLYHSELHNGYILPPVPLFYGGAQSSVYTDFDLDTGKKMSENVISSDRKWHTYVEYDKASGHQRFAYSSEDGNGAVQRNTIDFNNSGKAQIYRSFISYAGATTCAVRTVDYDPSNGKPIAEHSRELKSDDLTSMFFDRYLSPTTGASTREDGLFLPGGKEVHLEFGNGVGAKFEKH